jgi:AraC-type DNA-binding domain-containing proteins
MDYNYLDKDEYKEIPIIRIEENQNGLPFFIAKLDECNTSIHRHEFVQIVYMCKGKLKHIINKNSFDIFKGDIFIIPPYVPHYYVIEHTEKYELIEFEFIPEYINEKFSKVLEDNSFMDFAYLEPFFVSENEIKPRLNLKGSIQQEVENILGEVLKEYKAMQSGFELIIKAMLLKLLVIVGREFKRDIIGTESQSLFDRHRDALYTSINYINNNYIHEITIEEVSRVAMLSQSYFRYLFKQLTHKTFTEYVNDLRISKAIEMLKNNRELKILDICYEVGYNNINHFNKIFRQTTGTTPMSFRKAKI